MKMLEPGQVKSLLAGTGEVALLDTREHGLYGEGHPFLAVNCPLSMLELRILHLVPCKSTQVVLLDDGDGVAERAAGRMEALGYRNVAIMNGGAAAWSREGYTLFRGVNVPSKAFGELVEHHYGTPSIGPDQLRDLMAARSDLVVLDGRTPAEYEKMNIPGAHSCPNAETGFRIADLVPSPQTTIVVNCAGRTRSIIGTQTLRELGVENPVFALENGCQGWMLAGLELDRGSSAAPPDTISPKAERIARERASRFIREYAIRHVSYRQLQAWLREEDRTTYLFDVRSKPEFERGHIRDAQSAPGGQLVQATDHWIAVRRARVVVTDDGSARGAPTVRWLCAMGHDAYLLDQDVRDCPDLLDGPATPTDVPSVLPAIDLRSAIARLERGATLLDFSSSQAFRNGHLVGARWAIRPRVFALGLKPDDEIIVTAADPRIARLAARDLCDAGFSNIAGLDAVPSQWAAAGLVESTPDQPTPEEMIDFLFFVHGRHDGDLESARLYLEWELGLVSQLDDDERGIFSLPSPMSGAAE